MLFEQSNYTASLYFGILDNFWARDLYLVHSVVYRPCDAFSTDEEEPFIRGFRALWNVYEIFLPLYLREWRLHNMGTGVMNLAARWPLHLSSAVVVKYYITIHKFILIIIINYAAFQFSLRDFTRSVVQYLVLLRGSCLRRSGCWVINLWHRVVVDGWGGKGHGRRRPGAVRVGHGRRR